jgi:hypothetical protein
VLLLPHLPVCPHTRITIPELLNWLSWNLLSRNLNNICHCILILVEIGPEKTLLLKELHYSVWAKLTLLWNPSGKIPATYAKAWGTISDDIITQRERGARPRLTPSHLSQKALTSLVSLTKVKFSESTRIVTLYVVHFLKAKAVPLHATEWLWGEEV